MRQKLTCRIGFTLVELLVVIAIIGTLVGLLLPAVQSAREASRRSLCTVNLSQLQKALQMYEDSNELLPGYVNAMGIDGFDKSNASWVVMILPFLEQNALWDEWNNPSGIGGPIVPMDIVVCPSNPPFSSSVASLSYAVNAGSMRTSRRIFVTIVKNDVGTACFSTAQGSRKTSVITTQIANLRQTQSSTCLRPMFSRVTG